MRVCCLITTFNRHVTYLIKMSGSAIFGNVPKYKEHQSYDNNAMEEKPDKADSSITKQPSVRVQPVS